MGNKKYCKYDLSGEYGIGYTTNTNEPFLFDKEMYNIIKEYAWRLSPIGYIVAYDPKTKTVIYLHHLVLPNNNNNNFERDHINRDKKDNRKCNLRLISHKNNIRNGSKRHTNQNGIIGVFWREDRLCWMAYIDYDYKREYLGHYKNKKDAVITRLKAEKEIFGEEYAPQRHLFKEYNI